MIGQAKGCSQDMPERARRRPGGGLARPTAPLGSLPGPLPKLIVQSISDVVEVIDLQGVIVYSNLSPLARQRLGLAKVQGRKCSRVYDRVCLSCLDCPIDQVLATGSPLTRDCPVMLKAGGMNWARQHLYPIQDNAEQLTGVLRIVHDITNERRVRAKQEKYLSSLEQSLHNRGRPRPLPPALALSARELEVLSFLADGLSNQEIANLLAISLNTVKTHVVHIFNKLGVNGRTQAAVIATRLKLI